MRQQHILQRWMIEELKARRIQSNLRWWASRSYKRDSQIIAGSAALTLSESALLKHWTNDIQTRNKPLQYCLGTQPFAGLNLLVRAPILIPRCETEEMVMNIASLIKQSKLPHHTPFQILDLCTGSGCIALGLANQLAEEYPNLHITGLDITIHAIRLAKLNQRNLAIPRVAFKKGNIQHAIPSGFDMVISNPPYISHQEYHHHAFEKRVRDWEDIDALLSSKDDNDDDVGVHFYKSIADLACIPNSAFGLPRLVLEYGGLRQTDVLVKCFEEKGYVVQVLKDLFERERVLYCF